MDSFKNLFSSVSPRWTLIVLASALGIAAATVSAFESEEAKTKRAEQKRRKELRVLADRISHYARTVHQQFPTGDVVVSERDLAEQLRKRPDTVVTALNLLLNEQKVQQAPLNGYWKLNS
jgi:RecB family endonuclease NucS